MTQIPKYCFTSITVGDQAHKATPIPRRQPAMNIFLDWVDSTRRRQTKWPIEYELEAKAAKEKAEKEAKEKDRVTGHGESSTGSHGHSRADDHSGEHEQHPSRSGRGPRQSGADHSANDGHPPPFLPDQACMTAKDYLQRLRTSEHDPKTIVESRDYINEEILPRLSRQEGLQVDERYMKSVINIFAHSVFHEYLEPVRFRWQLDMQAAHDGNPTYWDDDLTFIALDPDPRGLPEGVDRGDAMLSHLLNACCHVTLLRHICRGQCGNAVHDAAWREDCVSGRAWRLLAYWAQHDVNHQELFHAVPVPERSAFGRTTEQN